MPDLPAPVHISPLIKFFRYTFLIAGIFYGAGKLKVLRASHSNQPEEIAKKRALREAHLAEEKQLAAERDFEQIVEIFRPPPRASVRLDPGSTSEVQFEGLLNKPLNLAEEEQGGYVIEDFEKTPIFLPDEGDCPIPPE